MDNQTNQPAQQPAQQPQGKKTNIALIIIIIVVILIVLGGVGGYLIYAKAKKTLKNAVSSTTPTSTTTDSSDTSGSSATDVFSQAKDNTPTDALTISLNNDLKPVLTQLFTTAKLESFAASSNDFSTLSYATKKAIANTDATSIETAMIAKGYTKTANVTTSDGFMLAFTKNDLTLTMHFQLSSPNEIIVGAERNTST